MNIPILKIHSNGTQSWLLDGKRHREDGPARIYPDGKHSWYLNNKYIDSFKEYQEELNLPGEDVTALILKYGNIE